MGKKKKNSVNPVFIIIFMVVLICSLLLVMDFLRAEKGMSSFLFNKTAVEKAVPDKTKNTKKIEKPASKKIKVKKYVDREVPPPEHISPPISIKGTPKIAIIIDDVGFDLETLAKAVQIKQPITFAVLPYTPHAVECARIIHNAGQEVILHQPMEPVGYPEVDPGKGVVLTSMNKQEIEETIKENIRSIPYITGVNNHMGSKATSDVATMKIALQTIKDWGLFFIDSRTSAQTVAYKMALEMNMPTAEKTLFIDNEHGVNYIRGKLDELARETETRKIGIGIGHIYPETVEALNEELSVLESRGFEFIFASEAVNLR